jgi:hypothetical protein
MIVKCLKFESIFFKQYGFQPFNLKKKKNDELIFIKDQKIIVDKLFKA